MRYKVNVSDLQTGMYVAELDRSWVGTPFLFQGFLIETDEELEQLKTTCSFVIVDEAQSKIPVAQVGKPPEGTTPAAKDVPSLKLADSGSSHATAVRAAAQDNIGGLFASAEQGGDLDSEIKQAQTIIERLVKQSAKPNLMMQLANLRPKQDRNAGHALNTAILAIAFGRHLGHSEERLRLLGLGAILHDIGKLRTPAEILNKPGELTDAEFAVVKRHPADGYEMLQSVAGLPSEVVDMVRYHHERIDGSGYPNGLRDDQVSLSAGIIGIVDAYETLTTDNSYQPAITPAEALQRLRTTGMAGYGQELTQDFMRFIGLYPVGSLVKLSSGDMAVVFASDPSNRLRPLVMIAYDAQGREIQPHRLVNLAGLPTEKLSIQSIIDPKKHAIDTSRLFEKELGH
ncbi:MAG: HD-GYP domain-containing protein [Gammaproteobacteria bacterium]